MELLVEEQSQEIAYLRNLLEGRTEIAKKHFQNLYELDEYVKDLHRDQIHDKDFLNQRIDRLREFVTAIKDQFLKHVEEALHVINAFPTLKAQVRVLEKQRSEEYDRADRRFLELNSLIDQIKIDFATNDRVTKDKIINALSELTAREIQPLRTQMEELASEVRDIQQSNEFTSHSRFQKDFNTLWNVVASLCDDAKKGEGFKGERLPRRESDQGSTTAAAQADLLARELTKAAKVTLEKGKFTAVDPPPYKSQSQDFTTKRIREEDQKHEPSAKRRLNMSESTHQLNLAAHQQLEPYLNAGILRSFLTSYNVRHRDDYWVPKEISDWWIRLKESFTKWFIICANLRKEEALILEEAWTYFLRNWNEQSKVRRLKEAAKDKKLNSIEPPILNYITSPKRNGTIDRGLIHQEANIISRIWGFTEEKDPVVFKELKDALYRIYGQNSY